MNVESNSKTQGTRSSKNTYKRAHRADRPVLVTQQEENLTLDEPTAQAIEETLQPEIPVADEAPIVSKRRPGFFSNIGKSSAEKADPQAVRMARATRGKVVDGPKTREMAGAKASTDSSKTGSVPQRPRSRSGFKTRYIWGMMGYLLIADFLGIWIQQLMVTHGLDGIVFKIGGFSASRSTLVFLALLILILIVMARLDLIPSSFKAALSNSDSASRKGTVPARKAATAATFETKKAQPTMKQGVSGQHDDLYQEYRENQRYFQKRDRKR